MAGEGFLKPFSAGQCSVAGQGEKALTPPPPTILAGLHISMHGTQMHGNATTMRRCLDWHKHTLAHQ